MDVQEIGMIAAGIGVISAVVWVVLGVLGIRLLGNINRSLKRDG
ncbi:MAG: hypothetical protein ACK5MT_00055 [Actinomycetales bacterium]